MDAEMRKEDCLKELLDIRIEKDIERQKTSEG